MGKKIHISIDELKDKILSDVRFRTLTPSTLLNVIITAMEIAEKFSSEGQTKKEAVVAAMAYLIEENIVDSGLRDFLLASLPVTIDIVCEISKKIYSLNIGKKCPLRLCY